MALGTRCYVKSRCWNPADLFIFKSFNQHFKKILKRMFILNREMQFLLQSLLWYSQMLLKWSHSIIPNVIWAIFLAANVAGGDPLKTVKALFNVRAVSCRDSQFLSQVSSVELEERGLGNRVSLNWLIKKNGPSFSLLPLI